MSTTLFIFAVITTSHAADDSEPRLDPVAHATTILDEEGFLQIQDVDVLSCGEVHEVRQHLMDVRGLQISDQTTFLNEADAWNIHLLDQRELRLCDDFLSEIEEGHDEVVDDLLEEIECLDLPKPVIERKPIEVIKEVPVASSEHDVRPDLEPDSGCNAQQKQISLLTTQVEVLIGERDQISGDNAILQERNENLIDNNVALTAQVGVLKRDLSIMQGHVSELETHSSQCPELICPIAECPECEVCIKPTVVEVTQCHEVEPVRQAQVIEVTEPDPAVAEMGLDATKPAFVPTQVLLQSIQAGDVADKTLITELDCDELTPLYWAVFDRSDSPHTTLPNKLPKSADQLNELRLARQAQERNCTLIPPSP